MTMTTMIWVVTFRESNKTPQQELTMYTEEAAKAFKELIIANGGVAIMTEDAIEEPSVDDFDTLPISPRDKEQLIWTDKPELGY